MADQYHILVVEDNPDMLTLMGQIVERAGYQVTLAGGGREAIDILKGGPVDLMLLDLMMKEVDGWAVLDYVKSDHRLRDIPTIIITARPPSQNLSIMEAHVGMFEDYLLKPFDVKQLLTRIAEILDAPPPAPTPRAAQPPPPRFAYGPKEFEPSAVGKTMATLFEMAIASEERAREFYGQLAAGFAHVPQAAAFWQDLMLDEEMHAQELRKICDRLPPGFLLAPVAPSLVGKARRGLDLAQQDHLSQIETLDDAFEIAQALESSEVNAIFELLMSRYLDTDDKEEIITTHVQGHTIKLVEFEQSFGDAEKRRTIQIQKPEAG